MLMSVVLTAHPRDSIVSIEFSSLPLILRGMAYVFDTLPGSSLSDLANSIPSTRSSHSAGDGSLSDGKNSSLVRAGSSLHYEGSTSTGDKGHVSLWPDLSLRFRLAETDTFGWVMAK